MTEKMENAMQQLRDAVIASNKAMGKTRIVPGEVNIMEHQRVEGTEGDRIYWERFFLTNGVRILARVMLYVDNSVFYRTYRDKFGSTVPEEWPMAYPENGRF